MRAPPAGFMLNIIACSIAWEIGWRIVGQEPEWWMNVLAGVAISVRWMWMQQHKK